MANYTWPVPLASPISQYFAANPYSPVQPQGHTGMDFAVSVGTPVYSIANGTVLYADWATKLAPGNKWFIAPGYAGIVVLIDHGGLISVYAHLDSTALNTGDRVHQGQQVARSGNTGLSTGPHLHFEVIPTPIPARVDWLAGRANPLNYITKVLVQSTGTTNPAPAPAPAPSLQANERMVGTGVVFQREQPNTNAKKIRDIQPNTKEVFHSFVKAQPVTVGSITTPIWYMDDDGYVWAGGLNNVSTNGLADKTMIRHIIRDSVANVRKTPHGDADVVRQIDAGSQVTIQGYAVGDKVGDSNVWYKLADGYIHFSTVVQKWFTGLPELPAPAKIVPAPPAPKPTTPAPAPTPAPSDASARKTGDFTTNVRKTPHGDAAVVKTLDPKSDIKILSYTTGDTVGSSDVWFKIFDGFIHSSTTDSSTAGLTKTAAPAKEEPSVDEEPPYEFTPDFDFVEYKPANTWNMQNGNFPAKPAKIVIHQFDAKDKRPSLDGVIGWFQTPRPKKPSSAHFGVSGDRIVQFVSLKDRAQHAGPIGNDYIGIEVDPQEDEKTIASVRKLIRALNKKYGTEFTYTKHRDVAGNSTECGVDIHLEKYKLDPIGETLPNPVPTPTPTPTPEPVPTPEVPVYQEAEILAKFLNFGLKKISDYLNKLLKEYLDSHNK